MVYLDNAATSYPKPKCVYDALIRSLHDAPGNPGRSAHKYSVRAAEAVYACREAVASLLGAENPEGVVFTYNATYALNLAIKSYIEPGSHVLVSDIEHNAVIRPLEQMKATGLIDYSVFNTDGDVESSIGSLIKKNTTAIISSNASNVTGRIIPLEKLSRAAKSGGLILIVDASQSIGHYEINLSKTPCDVICGPGHKGLFGIQGVGFAVFSDIVRRKSWVEGGSGVESINTKMPKYLPEGYEGGTLGTPAICSLRGGIEYISKIGIRTIEERLDCLTRGLYERINSINGIKIYSSGNGIVLFNFKDLPSSKTAELLDNENVFVRSGLHCAPSAHGLIGTLERGAVRASLSALNTINELDEVYSAVKYISDIY